MTTASAEPEADAPRVLHALRGRLRVHLPGWSGEDAESLEDQVRRVVPGILRAQANPRTRNVLVEFEPERTDEATLLAGLAAARPAGRGRGAGRDRPVRPPGRAEKPAPAPPARPTRAAGAGPFPKHVIREVGRFGRRARIAVPGLDRDPRLAKRVVRGLGRTPGVTRVTVSQLTGRVMVEFSEHQTTIEEILAHFARLDLPELPADDLPLHPLDPAPVVQSTARAIGSLAGLALLSGRRALGASEPLPGGSRGAQISGMIGIVEGLPAAGAVLERTLGRNGTQVALSGAAIISLSFAGNPLGLAVTAASSLRMMTMLRARRAAWRDYEDRVADAEPAHPGTEIEIEPGERVPLPGIVRSGFGTAVSRTGEVIAVVPGCHLDAGTRLAGGPIAVELQGQRRFDPRPRAAPPTPTVYDRYLRLVPPVSFAYALLAGVVTRSVGRMLTGLLLVNPRDAIIATENAEHAAAARVLRQGVTVVGTRERRPICRPDTLVIESVRTITDGLEVARAIPLTEAVDAAEVLRLAGSVSIAAGSPWGEIFPSEEAVEMVDGTFDGSVATAELNGGRWFLAAVRPPDAQRLAAVLELRTPADRAPLGRVELRLRPVAGLRRLLETCTAQGVRVELADQCTPAVAELAQRLGMTPTGGAALGRIRRRQARGAIVAVLSDSAHAAPEFAESDLAIGLSSGRSGRFAARVDLLAPDLASVAAIIDAGVQRDRAVRDSVLFSAASNVAGAVWGLGGNPRFERASVATYVAALGGILDGYVRLQGGTRSRRVRARLTDPRPERFGRQSAAQVLDNLDSGPDGLSSAEAKTRLRPREEMQSQDPVIAAILDQLRSPLTVILAGGAALSLALGAVGDVAMIGAVIAMNTAVGAWQERQAGAAAEALGEMSPRRAKVLRDGSPRELGADRLVRGDILLLEAGDRVPADARLIAADGLEVDEAALTGESVPVGKTSDGGTPASRVVLEGSDVTVGSARAVVVAVGKGTRMGATAAAIALEETAESPLGRRLSQVFRQGLPVIAGGGAVVTLAGVLWGNPLVPQLAIGASVALAAIPEGLPLLAGVAQAAVARRLAGRHALVQRLAAVEALGRVDVACADKTGTLTEGRLSLTRVSDPDGRRSVSPDQLPDDLAHVLDMAALASPHPDSPALQSHPTDIAVVEAAQQAQLQRMLQTERLEAPFEPSRGFHATLADARIAVKGAAEVLVPRCTRVRRGGENVELSEPGRVELLRRAEQLSGEGLRVLMVAEGRGADSPEDPHGLVALGFLGISDTLRANVPAAVQRCETAGVKVIMLTGDHPATATAIARDAGLLTNGGDVLVGAEIASLDDEELDRRLASTRVLARVNPLDKLRIVEALQRRGHVVAMTGDGVNDAPALRLADVGVAMGRRGTDVAREAADVVLADDDFSTLVETFVEGRGFWLNIRRALGLLLGGNLGELSIMVAAGVAGLASPLTTRQVFAINLVTDVLPALAVAVQEPEHRDLAGLAREGTAALDAPLRRDVVRRAIATGGPSFAAYVIASRGNDPTRARAVAFTSIIVCQLAQTLDVGLREGRLSREVLGAVGASLAFVGAGIAAGPFQRFLGLALPTPAGFALTLAATAGSLVLSRSVLANHSEDAPATRAAIAAA